MVEDSVIAAMHYRSTVLFVANDHARVEWVKIYGNVERM